MSLLTLLLQIAVVLGCARIVGILFRRIQQPQVMGEMVAGILLGPSLLGWLVPGVSATIFPPGSIAQLGPLSQTGVILFMFLVGLELNPKLLRNRGHAAVVTSHASIIAPFLLGSLLALYLYPRISDSSVRFLSFGLFMGAGMSVTAFPVLARILHERNLQRTKVGAVALACAAVDDLTAWCILAGVVAVARADKVEHPLPVTIFGSAAFILLMLYVVRPLLRRLEAYYHTRGRLTQDALGLVLLGVVASSYATESLGIHALFGAFLLGAIMPKDSGFVDEILGKLQDLVVVFLLPFFFAVTGLRTSIGLVHGAEMWLDVAAIVAVAVTGKWGGSTVAARLTGLGWREAGAVGVLMNTRGLMELVFITIGLEIGVISPALFTMMVLMALVTTFMTSPLLEWIYPTRLIRQETFGVVEEEKEYGVLIPVALPSAGPELLRLADALTSAGRRRIYVLHLIRAGEQSRIDPDRLALQAESETLGPLLAAAAEHEIAVRPLSFVSRDIGEDIVEVARAKAIDLILMGWHKPVLRQSILTGTVSDVMANARADVAVYLPRHFRAWRRVLVPYLGEEHDLLAFELAQRLAAHEGVEITVLQVKDRAGPRPASPLSLAPREDAGAPRIALCSITGRDPIGVVISEAQRDYDLVILGASESFGLEPGPFGARHERMARECPASLLVVRRFERAD